MKSIFFLTLFAFSTGLYAQAPQGTEPKCDDEAKLRAFIRKGAMTKEFCLKIQGDKINLFVTGDFYSLGSDNQNLVSKGEISGDHAERSTPTSQKSDPVKAEKNEVTLAKSASAIFAGITLRLIDKVKYLTDPPKPVALKLEGIGYADGVRYKEKYYDQNILLEYFTQESKQFAMDNGGALTITKKEFVDEATDTKNDKSNLGAKAPPGFTNILDPTRNIYLAEQRAKHLLKLIFGGKFDATVIETAKINGYHSPSLATGENLCKGYCSFRRGAKLTMTIPDLNKLNTGKPTIHPIPAPIISLLPAHYKRYLELNLYNHLDEITTYLNSSNHPYKEAIKYFTISNSAFSIFLKQGVKRVVLPTPKPVAYVQEKVEKITECKGPIYTAYFDIDCKEKKEDRYIINTEGQKLLKESGKVKKSDAAALIKQEIDFFKAFIKHSTGLTVADDSVYLHWSRIFFWTSVGQINFDESSRQISFLPNAPLIRKLDSNKEVKVTLSPPGLGSHLVREIIEHCTELLPKAQTAGCDGVKEYITDFWDGKSDEKSVRKKFLSVQSIFASIVKTASGSDELEQLASKQIFNKYFDGNIEESADLHPSPDVVITAKQLSLEIGRAQKDPKFASSFAVNKNAPDLVEASSDGQDLKDSVVRNSDQTGSTTSIFNATNTRLGSLWALRNYPKDYTDVVLRPIVPHEGVSAIFLNVDRVSSYDTDVATHKIEFKGFFHDQCKSGVLFKMNKETTQFHYLARISSRIDYTDSAPNKLYEALYKDTTEYHKTETRATQIPPFIMINTKQPSTYVIPNCADCNCVKQIINKFPLDSTGAATKYSKQKLIDVFALAQEFETLLKEKAYRLDFQRDFVQTENPIKNKTDHKAAGIKGTWRAQVPYKSYPAKDILAMMNAKEGESLNSSYCMYSPVVPQAHSAGDGKALDAASIVPVPKEVPENNCALLEFLDSTKDGKQVFPDQEKMKPEIVDSIAQYCSSMSTNLGDLTKCEEPGQLCIGLSKEMKEYYKNQCARTTSTMGNGSDPKDAEFCLQLTKD